MIVHETPGLLDIRALTVMGLSAKPGTKSPIGMFGTGLKYAIATLCRLGAEPVVWIGHDRYTFKTRPGKFRGEEFQQIRARLETPRLLKPRYVQLPFTTQYGKFWEPWMAFRELEANTRDEGGETYAVGGISNVLPSNVTMIVIDHPDYDACFRDIDTVFLPGALRNTSGLGPKVQAFPGETRLIYWRGLRVKELPKPCVATWNILQDMTLTEDRTLLSEWAARRAVGRFIAVDCRDEALVERVVAASDKCWEHRMDWPVGEEPSALFKTVAARHRTAPGLRGYIGTYEPKPAGKRTAMQVHPVPWALNDEEEPTAIVDKYGTEIFAQPVDAPVLWEELARGIVNRVNAQDVRAAPGINDRDGKAAVDDNIPF